MQKYKIHLSFKVKKSFPVNIFYPKLPKLGSFSFTSFKFCLRNISNDLLLSNKLVNPEEWSTRSALHGIDFKLDEVFAG